MKFYLNDDLGVDFIFSLQRQTKASMDRHNTYL